MRKFGVVISILGLLFVVGIAAAQSEVAPGTTPEQGTLTAAFELIIKAITDATYVPAAAGLVLVLTGLFKRLFPESINAGVIALVFQVVAWVAWVLALHFGYSEQFSTWVSALTTILTALMGMVGSSVLSTLVHESAAKNNVPVIGYKRDKDFGSNV